MNHSSKEQLTYLALGDSYTIGEAVPLQKSFPYQAVQLLREDGWNVAGPEIVAQTGWTTDELLAAINTHRLFPSYGMVSLLIGVNNQYRGHPIAQYAMELNLLVQKAIALAGGLPNRVVLLSIPDYSATPFAEKMERKKIAEELAAYNQIASSTAKKEQVHYIDITASSQEAAHNPALVAADGLHPSALEYGKWALLVSSLVRNLMAGLHQP